MISMSEYYIIIGKHEIGENVEKLLSIYRQCGKIERLADHAFKIHNASKLDQSSTFEELEKAIEADFSPDCDHCGNQPGECDCEPDPEAEDNAYWSGDRIHNCEVCKTPLHLPGICRDCLPNAQTSRPAVTDPQTTNPHGAGSAASTLLGN